MHLLDIIDLVGVRHPSVGVFGWILLSLWVSVGLLMAPMVTDLCNKKRNRRGGCYMEGVAASGLYFFASFVVYLSLNWK